MPPKTKAPDLSRAVALYREGYGFGPIAKVLGVSPSTVARFLHGEGVTIRRVGAIPLEKRPGGAQWKTLRGAAKGLQRMLAAEDPNRKDRRKGVSKARPRGRQRAQGAEHPAMKPLRRIAGHLAKLVKKPEARKALRGLAAGTVTPKAALRVAAKLQEASKPAGPWRDAGEPVRQQVKRAGVVTTLELAPAEVRRLAKKGARTLAGKQAGKIKRMRHVLSRAR